ncbi:uncharacterized protein LOC100889957 [Strongylocentrotus purpuratus]|uniref:Uncharacterized protein n=1 Tax=Strongylocentrotus purpuratus TaxID=7668 RepID=A0A7M7GKM6_STRPU|nr:uncharacterized protein LOC100889957 [Strongylocentrotus purpuratus]
METMLFFGVVLIGCFTICSGSVSSTSRFCVIANRVGSSGVGRQRLLAFRSNAAASPVSVEVSYGDVDPSAAGWSPWKTIGAPLASPPLSNPVCEMTEQNQTQIFVQASDGQVYSVIQDTINFLNFSSWKKVGSNSIPTSLKNRSLLVDSVSAVWYHKERMIFARSISTSSMLYWCKGTPTNCTWGLVSGTTLLGTDATLIKNPFTAKYEGFMISQKGRIYRTWQHASGNSFAGWKEMASAPHFSVVSRPVAQVMGYNGFNGKIMVGGIGVDNFVHRCLQLTCDTVDNPWSYCTWGNWHQTGGEIPFDNGGMHNNLVMSRNVHFGVEIFAVHETNGQLWQTWQPARDTSWNVWRKIPQNLTGAAFTNNPFLLLNEAGWWIAYGLNYKNQVVPVEALRSMDISSKKVAWTQNLVVSWIISNDQASNMDWIGVYPKGANDDQYLDYRYVQGGLNPGKSAVYIGNVSISSFVPNGAYQVRYLVNSQFISIMEMDVTFYNESGESHMLQLFRGIYTGLEASTDNIDACINEGLETIEMFEECFHAFKMGKVFQGLQLLGTALEDVAQTLTKCNLISIAKKLLGYITDLLECMEGNCVKFVIDVIEELRILYLNRYEIYGDIRGAENSFKQKAYQQGGLCIGRFVKACFLVHDSLMSNGSWGEVKLNGTISGEGVKMIRTGRMNGVTGTKAGSKEVVKMTGNNSRNALKLIANGRSENMKLIESGSKIGVKLIKTGRKKG